MGYPSKVREIKQNIPPFEYKLYRISVFLNLFRGVAFYALTTRCPVLTSGILHYQVRDMATIEHTNRVEVAWYTLLSAYVPSTRSLVLKSAHGGTRKPPLDRGYGVVSYGPMQ